MTTKLRILGFRAGVTKAQTLDGQHVYLNGEAGKPNDRVEVDSQHVHGRLSAGWQKLKNKFHD